MLIRETAEAVGLKVPARKYRENMENDCMYGKIKEFQNTWLNTEIKLKAD